MKLLMLTGQRRDEFGGLRWSEIDFDKGWIVLPPARTKNKLKHVIPMSEPVTAIITKRKPIVGRNCVFGITNGGGFSSRYFSKAKLPNDPEWRLHDIRRTVATGMADDIGIQPHIIEAVLNHISGHKAGVAGIYNWATYIKEKTEALNQWAAHLLTVVAI